MKWVLIQLSRRFLVLGVVFALVLTSASAAELLEPRMRIAPGGAAGPQVALTLDACSGGVDMRIINALIANDIKATLFITRRWLDRNPEAVAQLRAHADLFDFEDHGAEHVPAVIGEQRPYGIRPAGNSVAVLAEVMGGAEAVEATFGDDINFYRGATALYSPDAISLIEDLGFQIAGFSLNGDWGASASAATTESNIAAAVDGDVIIAHMNQPNRASGPGVVAGVLALKARGFSFVRLDEVEVIAE